ncbi:hypothetical protein [Paraburkholderia hospita]|jgi:hypothetical protein|uniref:hypothetical protein n=1 Tax=Paraburkholderia hospita TaxID=169430 RepID=UPI000DEF6DD5|nr:hypothetical protein [Paraburkholderia hospita]AXF01534.1 hypothetical protein CUJ88_24140 [Paraburkholderia hospita]
MTDDAGEQDDMFRSQVDLHDREFALIGSIVAHWGALEHEIFIQTANTYAEGDTQVSPLPSAMRNNTSFTAVLDLWKRRVVDKADAAVKPILLKQIDAIDALSDYRNALVHGMWHWTPEHPGEIITSRVVKGKYLSVRFPPDALADFAERVQTIYTRVRYPRGVEDFAAEYAADGGGLRVSRRGFDTLFGDGSPVNGDFG